MIARLDFTVTIGELKQAIENLFDDFNVSVCCPEEQSVCDINYVHIDKNFKQIIIFGSGGNDE